MMSQGPVVLFSCLGVGTVQRLIYYVAFCNLACIFQTELCAATYWYVGLVLLHNIGVL